MLKLGENLYNKFPELYLSEDAKNGYALKKFMEVLGGGFDKAERDIINFSNIYNADLCPSSLLPLLAEQYGLEFPYDMDEATQRKFIKVLPFLYQYKGTDKAFKYLAREIFGEGTVTNSYTLSPPEGVSWEEWINDPKTKEDWQKVFVRLEVNGENLYLDNREVNFIKFAELLRPVNRIIIPNLVLFYSDKRDKALTQETYAWDWVQEDNGIFVYRQRDGKDIIKEQEEVAKIITLPENESYITRERVYDGLDAFNLTKGKLSNIYYKLSEFNPLDIITFSPEDEIREQATKSIIYIDKSFLDDGQDTFDKSKIKEVLDSVSVSDDLDEVYNSVDYILDSESPLLLSSGLLTNRHNRLSDIWDFGKITFEPDEDIRSKLMYDEHFIDKFVYNDSDEFKIKSNGDNVDTISFKDTNSDIATQLRDDTYNYDITEVVETDTLITTKLDDHIKDVLNGGITDEIVAKKSSEIYFSSTLQVTRTDTAKLVTSRLVTNFRTTDFIPTNTNLNY